MDFPSVEQSELDGKKLPLVAYVYVIGVRSCDKGIYNSASKKIAHSRLFLCRLPLVIVML